MQTVDAAAQHAGCNGEILALLSTYLQMRQPGHVGQIYDHYTSTHVLTLRSPNGQRLAPTPANWTQLRLPGYLCHGVTRKELLGLLADPMFAQLIDMEPCIEFYIGKLGLAAREMGAAVVEEVRSESAPAHNTGVLIQTVSSDRSR